MTPTSPRRDRPLRLGLIAPKNSPAEEEWLLGYLRGVDAEPYRRGALYDLVWFLNVTGEIRFLKRHTTTRTHVVGMEPKFRYPANYRPDLLKLADRYQAYRNFAGPAFQGDFEPFTFPVYPRAKIREEFPRSMQAERDTDFCLFAFHDPNIRRRIAEAITPLGGIAAGPLFGKKVDSKLPVQRRCRFEFITENDINDYYFSEKLGESLTAGCVPVYYGCTAIKEHVPPALFIDMRDFAGDDGLPDVARVVEHCLAPGVYERHRRAIETRAMQVLLDRFSLEHCLIEPVQRTIDALRDEGRRARPITWRWHYWAVRGLCRRLLRRG